MSSVNLLASTTECVCCAANGLSLIKLKRWNAICIGCCCLLSISGLTLSSYFIYKYIRLKKSLNNFDKKIEELSQQLNLLNEENKVNEKKSMPLNVKRVKIDVDSQGAVVTSSNRKLNEPRSKSSDTEIRQRSSILSRYSSVDTLTDNSEKYETPTSTPPKSLSLNDVYNNDQIEEQNAQSAERKIIDLDKLDDNRTLDLIIMQSYENKKLLCSTKEIQYEQVFIYLFQAFFLF